MGQNETHPVVAILNRDKLNNGILITQNTYQLQYTPRNNQFLDFRIVDRNMNNVCLNENSYFTLQITRCE